MPTDASIHAKTFERTITVSASGAVQAEPDIAQVSTGVIVEADNARDALSRNTAVMAALLDGLKKLGIGAQDIQTSQFSVEPRYVQARDGQPATIAGYRVVNQLGIVLRELKRLGEVLDACVRLGANQMGGIRFEVSKAETLKDEARRRAMENAIRRATLYAEAAGARLGAVISISEQTGFAPMTRGMLTRSMMAEAVPVEAGAETLEASISVTWALV